MVASDNTPVFCCICVNLTYSLGYNLGVKLHPPQSGRIVHFHDYYACPSSRWERRHYVFRLSVHLCVYVCTLVESFLLPTSSWHCFDRHIIFLNCQVCQMQVYQNTLAFIWRLLNFKEWCGLCKLVRRWIIWKRDWCYVKNLWNIH